MTEEPSSKIIEILVSNKKGPKEPSTTEPNQNKMSISSTNIDNDLPRTGEEKSFLLIVLGGLVILVGTLILRIKRT